MEATLMRDALQDFGLDQVTLTGEYHVNAFEKGLHYLRSYDADRLLAGFRETRGLAPNAEKYPGWENTEIRGHTLGHYMTALAQACSHTKDPVLMERLSYIVSELSLSQTNLHLLIAFYGI